jgi:predicted transcriptional regulator
MAGPLNRFVELPEATEARLLRLADARHTPAEGLLLEAVEQYVAREERRGAMLRDATLAWEVFESDGQHATFEEVDAWLARLEAGEDAPPPACHG